MKGVMKDGSQCFGCMSMHETIELSGRIREEFNVIMERQGSWSTLDSVISSHSRNDHRMSGGSTVYDYAFFGFSFIFFPFQFLWLHLFLASSWEDLGVP